MDVTDFKQQFLPLPPEALSGSQLMGNAQDAEDMVQEAYLKLWNKRGQLNGVLNAEATASLLSRICATMHCVVTSWMRTDVPPEELNISADFNIISEMEWRDEVNQVQRLISQLPGSKSM